MDLKLQNKIIIISGGASGIGEAIVCLLAKEGAVPVIADRSEALGKALEGKIVNEGGKCLYVKGDLSEAEACKMVVNQTLSNFGEIDGMVNNAGVNDGAGLEKGPEAFRRSVANNLFHYFDLVHYALPALKKSQGAIVNISSKTALTGQGGTSGYSASKGAQLALTREWAVELAPFGVRVNAVIPAEVMTPQYETWLATLADTEKDLQKIKGRIPLGNRMTTPDEIAAMTVFLLSERSAHTTGQWIFVDGGYVHLDRAIEPGHDS